MIRARFERSENSFRSVRMSGHAGYAEAGGDIVCAAVTSAFQMAANGITEVLGEGARVSIGNNTATIALPDKPLKGSIAFLDALHLHLSLLCEQYPGYIEIIISEV